MNTDILHPVTVHFPIALIITGFLFEVLSLIFKKEHCLSKAGYYLLILGTLGAIAAVLAGEFFSKNLIGFGGEKKAIHAMFAHTTMLIMIITAILRIILVVKKKENGGIKWVYLLFYFAGCCLVAYTGLLGGKLVYEIML